MRLEMTFTLQSAKQTGALPSLGFVRDDVRLLLRIEGMAVLAAACAAYAQTGSSWVLFAVLFLAPDLSFLAYYGGAAAGTFVYNSFHTYVVPLALLTAGLVFYPEIIPYTFIWIAHLGFDRALGYGLKYPSAFGHTHLGLVGKAGPA
jgi:hypothetical protein